MEQTTAQRVTCYFGQDSRHNGKALHDVILEKARKMGLSGATVVHGVAGFGANSRIHKATILRLSEDLPLILEVVDTEENLQPFLDFLNDVMTEGMVTVEPVHVHLYRHDANKIYR